MTMRPPDTEDRAIIVRPRSDVRLSARYIVSLLVILAILPSLFFAGALQLTKASGPQWLGSNFENSYVYLLNSLLIVNGKPPSHIDHPGTTTQLFGAACLRLAQPGSTGALTNAVLERPEPFLRKMQHALLLLSALAVWLFPLQIALRMRSAVRGLLLQIPILFFITIFTYSIWYGSDLFLIVPGFAAVCICALLLKERQAGTTKVSTCVLAGIICGFGITTKLTFFPLILITVFCCRGWKNLRFFGTGFVVTSALILIPIYSELPRVFAWIVGLATHSGYYGTGEIGFARADAYFPDIVQLLSSEPMLTLIPPIATGATLYVSFRSRTCEPGPGRAGLARTAVGIFLLQLLSFLLIAKHPNNHYLIPLDLSTGLNLLLMDEAFRRPGATPRGKGLIIATLGVLTVVGITNLSFKVTAYHKALRLARHDQLSFYARVNVRTRDAVRVDYYRSISPEFAFYFGNAYAGGAFAGALKEKYPRALFYNIFDGLFEDFTNSIEPPEVLRRYSHLYFLGNPNLFHSSGFGTQRYFNAKGLKEIDHQGDYVLQEWIRPD